MKSSLLLLTPLIAIFISGCAAGPGGVVYRDYGPGPNPRAGYYWNGTVYVQGENPYYQHHNRYNRETTNVNDVNINRTVNDRTTNNTRNTRVVNNRHLSKTTVNRATANRHNTAVQKSTAEKKTHKPKPENQTNQPGNQ